MERMTYDFCIGGNHCWQVKGADNLECREVCKRQGDDGCKTCPIAKAFDRLAAYEDTGLEPEEIAKIREDVENGYMKSTARRYGISVDRLRELAQADREGRCMVLPKDGMVYYIEEAGGEKWIGNKPIQQVILRCGFGMALLEFSLFDKGKYFSRAEAEEALRREQE